MSGPEPAPRPMTAEQFADWAMEQPEGRHYELVDGEVVEVDAERIGHARRKLQIVRKLADAIDVGRLASEAFGDGMAVRIDANTVFEPDAMVRCGGPLSDDVTLIPDPVIVVEVRSPSSVRRDSSEKLIGYFRLPSVRHYLIVQTGTSAVIHHERGEAGQIATTIVHQGPLRLDPPGIVLEGLFG